MTWKDDDFERWIDEALTPPGEAEPGLEERVLAHINVVGKRRWRWTLSALAAAAVLTFVVLLSWHRPQRIECKTIVNAPVQTASPVAQKITRRAELLKQMPALSMARLPKASGEKTIRDSKRQNGGLFAMERTDVTDDSSAEFGSFDADDAKAKQSLSKMELEPISIAPIQIDPVGEGQDN